MISTFCISNDSTITYFSSSFHQKRKFNLKDLGEYFHPTLLEKPHSTPVSRLAGEKWVEPQHIYHLAGVIHKAHPEVEWDWENQFISIESDWRSDRYYNEYLALFGAKHLRDLRFILRSDGAWEDWGLGFLNYQRERESDESIKERVLERLNKWVCR